MEYKTDRSKDTINNDKLEAELTAVDSSITGFRTEGGFVIVTASVELSANRVQEALAVVASHQATLTPAQAQAQARLTALRNYLDSRVDDLQYAEYFFVLQKKLLDLWRSRPNLTDTTVAVIAAVQGNRAVDPTHLAMWNSFCWKVNIDFGIPVTSGELPASPTAAQARQIIQCAYDFSNTGIVMANMILLNQRV